MRWKPLAGAALVGAFLVSTAAPASASILGTAGMFVPLSPDCGGLHLLDDTVRVSPELFEDHGCDSEVEVERDGVTVKAKVVDRCDGCKFGDIDLSPAAFVRIGRASEERVTVRWNFI